MSIEHKGESRSNALRRVVDEREPVALRTFTPTQLTIEKSAGVFHWTADGRKLYDYTSGVLVANLGHNPVEWQKKIRGLHGLARYAVGRWLFRIDSLDGLQRHHHHRSRCGPASGRAPAVQARRETPRADHVGGVRLGGDPEGALGRAGRRSRPAISSSPRATDFTARKGSPRR